MTAPKMECPCGDGSGCADLAAPTVDLRIGDCRQVLRDIPDASLDACVTDPPYELGFMGKRWDASGVAFEPETWKEVFRVLKPGAHLLAFGGTRTSHRMVCAIEDAGFEIRDSICWAYFTGFPKSLDVGKALDRAAGAEREVVGENSNYRKLQDDPSAYNLSRNPNLTVAFTPEAQQWDGWGTAMKPAFEPICVARKPLIGTVAENILAHGTGALNVDGCRVGSETIRSNGCASSGLNRRNYQQGARPKEYETNFAPSEHQGRWPANLLLGCCGEDPHLPGCPVADLDRQSGASSSPAIVTQGQSGSQQAGLMYSGKDQRDKRKVAGHSDSGGASRFVHVFEPDSPLLAYPKPTRGERDAGCYELEDATRNRVNAGGLEHDPRWGPVTAKNSHTTVKPLALMLHLCRLVCRPGGLILDPFMGSGTTGRAARLLGMNFIGVELEAPSLEIARARIMAPLTAHKAKILKRKPLGTLFDGVEP